uniref:Uncharacterized protein n=1 Tax=Lotus japonicus TaxID=34305 RepID=I3T1C9_LOTJA|nr:unknown [Lotus japonicus]
MLRKIGILWHENEPSELSPGTLPPRKCNCCKKCHNLGWDMLPHSIAWSLFS